MIAITSTGPTEERRRRAWIAACRPDSNLGGATGEGVLGLTTTAATDAADDAAGDAIVGAPVEARRRLWICAANAAFNTGGAVIDAGGEMIF
jgi:hypothetical protein